MMWVLDVLWSWHLLAAVIFGAGWVAVRGRRARRAATSGGAPAPGGPGGRSMLGLSRRGHVPGLGRGGGM